MDLTDLRVSCSARAPFETTDWHGRVLWSDHLQGIEVTQAKSALVLECMGFDLEGRTLESALTSTEITGYRSLLGQLLWLGQQSWPNPCVGVSLAAQKLSKATISDIKALNKLVDQAKITAEMVIVIPSRVVNLKTLFICVLRRRWFRKC